MTDAVAPAAAIDVVVPTYWRPDLLQRCLKALASQVRVADRIIVVARVDDEASHEVVRRLAAGIRGLELVTVDRPGVLAAMSAGVGASTAPIVAFTDDDSAPWADWIERLLAHFDDPTVGAVGGRDVVRGDEGPLTNQVGVFRRSGRLLGNHHLGEGPPRDVDVLKGVNMAFRAGALALPAPEVLRGAGAQVDYEVLCCAFALRHGWRVLYDPAVKVDHEGAFRHGADRRVRPRASAVRDAAFNSVVAGCALGPDRHLRNVAYGLAIGTRDRPGLGRALLGLSRGEREVLRRTGPALAGRLGGVVWLLCRAAAHSQFVVTAAELRNIAKARPRVALVAHDVHDHGGMERACAELIRNLHERVAFTVVSATLAPELRPLVERWVRVWVPARPFPVKFVAFFVRASLVLRRLEVDLRNTVGAIVGNKADVVAVYHCHAGQREAVGSMSLVSLSAPRRLNTGISRWIALFAERAVYKPSRAGVLVCATESLAEEVGFHYPNLPTIVIPNGVAGLERMNMWPASHRAEIRENLGAGETAIVLLFLGGDWHRKGLPTVLDALALLDVDLEVELWVVGRGDRNAVDRTAESLGISRRVTVVGPVPDVVPIYMAADIFVLASTYETFSIPCFEAAASGLPVITTAVHGARELVRDDGAGILVEPTATSIACAVSRLATDPELRRTMGMEGRRRANGYTWGRTSTETLALYRSLLGARLT